MTKRKRVLVIGDTHCPAMRPEYPAFLDDIRNYYSCNEIVHIGDLIDWGSISYHEHHPSQASAGDEFGQAMEQVQVLYEMFPRATWLIGNHDALTKRKAITAGIPVMAMRNYTELWEIPKWKSVNRFGTHEIDGVIYAHGDKGKQGQMPAIKNAKENFCNWVQGHTHSQAGVNFFANERTRVFGMNVGCGVDDRGLAMLYGRKFNSRSVLGCGVVLEGETAVFEPLQLENQI